MLHLDAQLRLRQPLGTVDYHKASDREGASEEDGQSTENCLEAPETWGSECGVAVGAAKRTMLHRSSMKVVSDATLRWMCLRDVRKLAGQRVTESKTRSGFGRCGEGPGSNSARSQLFWLMLSTFRSSQPHLDPRAQESGLSSTLTLNDPTAAAAMIRRPPTSLTLTQQEVEDLRTSRIAATGIQMHVGHAKEAQQQRNAEDDDDTASSSANDEDSGPQEHAADREQRERLERSEAERIAGQR